ncbi:MAG: four helix bundle protein [Planctomycetota bacterium]
MYVSLGSCAELDTQVVIAHRRDYIPKKELEELAEEINHENRMLASLINKI